MSVLTNIGYDTLHPYNHAGKLSVIALFLIRDIQKIVN